MDPLTAFSLACGVIQVVDFSMKLLSKSREIYKNGSLVENKEIESMAEFLTNLRTDMNVSITTPSPGDTQQFFDDENQLKDLAIKCSETSQELIAELQLLQIQGPHRKRQALSRGLKVILKKDAIEDIQKKLSQYQKILDTRVLVNLRQQINLVFTQQGESFRRLDDRVQNLVIGLTKEQNGFQELKEQLRKETSSRNEHISDQFQRHRKELADNEFRKQFLESLYFPEIKARQEEIAEAHKSTFQWIFNDADQGVHQWDNFVQWLESGHGIYWISGKAGSGKSTLMSYICEDSRTVHSLKVWSGTTEILVPTFFFWSPGSAMQKSSVGLLRSLVYQILETFPHLIPILTGSGKSEYPSGSLTSATDRLKTIPAWTERRLQMTLQRIVRELTSSRLCFFIDGLDEFIGNYSALIEMIEDMIQSSNVKICVSSRPYRPFVHAFGRFPKLKLQDLTEQDIREYARDRLSSLPRTELLVAGHLTWIPDTVDKILAKADGVFLWVRLAIDDQIEGAKDEDSPEQLAERLKLLPSEMGDLYAHTLNKISKAHRKEAVRYLQLVLHNQTPNPSLLKIALAVYDKLDDLLSIPSETRIPDVIAHCNIIAKRIATICAGFLEISSGYNGYKQNAFSGADLEWADFESDFMGPNYMSEDKAKFRVRFLHKTTIDFLLEDERGTKFSDVNSTVNFDPYTSYIRAELGFLIIFVASQRLPLHFGFYVSKLMTSAFHAEKNTGVAQVALLDHVDRTIAKMVKPYDNESPLLHWCDWVPVSGVYLDRTGRVCSGSEDALRAEIEDRQNLSSGPTATFPVIFLGLAAQHGLLLYVQQKLETGYGPFHRQTASYLLCCAIVDPYSRPTGADRSPIDSKNVGLIVTLLKGGADPNMVAFDGTIWVQVLRQINRWYFSHPLEVRIKVITAFLDSGANVHETIEESGGSKVTRSAFGEPSHIVASLVSRTGIRHEIFFLWTNIQRSALSVVEQFLGQAPGLEEIQRIFIAKGAFSYIKCLTLDFDFGGVCPNESYALSQQQSDKFLEIWSPLQEAEYMSAYPREVPVLKYREYSELYQELKSQPMESDDVPDHGEVLDEGDLPDDDSVYYSIPSTPTEQGISPRLPVRRGSND